MLGVLTWLACGVVVGVVVNKLVSGYDKGIVLLTLGVGIAGAIAGGFFASLLSYGDGATFSLYALVFATIGAALTLFGYVRMIDA